MNLKPCCLAGAVSLALAGCSSSPTGATSTNSVAGSTVLPPAAATAGKTPKRTTSTLNLYIGGQGYVAVVAPKTTKPLRTLTRGIGVAGSLAFDQDQNLYVPGLSGNVGRIKVFAPDGTNPVRTITRGLSNPLALVFDDQNSLYVSSLGHDYINVYANGQNKIDRKIQTFGEQLLIDSASYLYASSSGYVNVVAPGQNTSYLVLQVGGSGTSIFTLDRSDNLYVANVGSNEPTITEFAPHSDTIIRTIATSTASPTALVVDKSGKLYCAYVNQINVYAPGSNKVVRTITDHISQPSALAIDANNTLYVANMGSGSVTEYVPGSPSTRRTIPSMPSPAALSFGP